MKNLGYIFIGFAVLMFAALGYDEHRGVIKEFRSPIVIRKQVDPGKFRDEMTGKCALTILILLVGIVFCTLEGIMDRDDPMSPDTEGNEALEDKDEESDG